MTHRNIIKEPDTSDKLLDVMILRVNTVIRSILCCHFVLSVLFRLCFLIGLINVSCISSDRPDIVFDDFESGNFDNWNRLGVAFDKPSQLDSVKGNVENVQGRFFVFSDFEGSEKSPDQGKLVSKAFKIDRKYISFLIAGGHHNTRECVNLIIDNKIVRFASGEDDHKLRKVTWHVDDLQGKNAVIEIVDAIAARTDRNAVPYIIVDNIVFSDFKYSSKEVFEDFESGTYDNWTVQGDAFDVPRNRTNVYYPISINGFNGEYFAFSFGDSQDAMEGKLTSRPFNIKYGHIKFLIGGGDFEKKTCINLLVNDSVVFSAVGNKDGQMRWHDWDVGPFVGRRAEIEIVDHYSQSWGHIMVDDIIFYDKPEGPAILSYVGIGFLIFLFLSFFIFKIRRSSRKKIKPKVPLSEEEIEKFEKLKASIKMSEIYKEHNPSINQIVENSGINEKDINLLFEKAGNTTLPDYINRLRVEEFKRQLKDPSNKTYTMIYLAKISGFSSRTSFYRIFKSITKITPSEYKKNLDGKN